MTTTVAAAEGTDDTKPFLIEGFIEISIGDEKFKLDGIVGAYLKVEYHKPFEEAVSLGTIPEMVGAVASGLGVADGATFAGNLTNRIGDLGRVPGLQPVAKILNEGVVKVTDLAIDTQEGKYQFGFGVDLTGLEPPIGYAGITLDAFGLLFTYTKPKE